MELSPTAALIVVDLQRGFDDAAHWGVRNNPECEANIVALVGAWRTAGRPLVFVRHDSAEPGSPLRPGTPGNALRPELEDIEPDLLVAKSVNAAFFGEPALAPWLRARDAETIVRRAAISTNHCVETTARVGREPGLRRALRAGRDVHLRPRGTGRRRASAPTSSPAATATSLHGEFATIVRTGGADAEPSPTAGPRRRHGRRRPRRRCSDRPAAGTPDAVTRRRAVLALDLGSSSVRAGFVDTDGEVLAAHAKRPYTLETGEDGRSQADPDALLELVAEAIDEALVRAPRRRRADRRGGELLHALGLRRRRATAGRPRRCSCGPTAAPRPTPARCASELDERAVHRRTGCVLHTSYVPAKLRWLQRTAPAEAERTARWISAGEYVTLTLLRRGAGEPVAGVGHRAARRRRPRLGRGGAGRDRRGGRAALPRSPRRRWTGCTATGRSAGRRWRSCPGSRPPGTARARTSAAAPRPRSARR